MFFNLLIWFPSPFSPCQFLKRRCLDLAGGARIPYLRMLPHTDPDILAPSAYGEDRMAEAECLTSGVTEAASIVSPA